MMDGGGHEGGREPDDVDRLIEVGLDRYGKGDVNVMISLAAIVGFLAVCMAAIWWIFKTGWKLKN